MGWILTGIRWIWKIVKAIYSTDKPVEKVVTHVEPDIKISDGKSDADRLKDLGL